MNEVAIDVVLLGMLAVTAVLIGRQKNLLSAVMLSGIFSLLGAGWMLFLDAPDVAFTEAAVGAGISTILMLATLSATTAEEKNVRESPGALAVVVLTGAVLVYATLDMPRYGDPASPANRSMLTAAYLHSAHPPPENDGHASDHVPRGGSEALAHGDLQAYEVGIPNTVTTVLASFRGYDTMGETAVIFTAGLGVVVILGGARRRRFHPPEEVAAKAAAERAEDSAGAPGDTHAAAGSDGGAP